MSSPEMMFADGHGQSETQPATDDASQVYRSMCLSRAFDLYCSSLLRAGKALPHFHSGVGQEALSVAAAATLCQHDSLVYSHRGIGQLLAKGVSIGEIVHDLIMVEGGTNGGIGSVMHVSRPDIGVHGREGVFGTRFGISVGLALAAALQERDDVVMCFYGEAAGARGQLYEALNMAVLWSLPIVLVAENNGWSFTSRTAWLYPGGQMARVLRGFDIPVTEVDGNDAQAVAHAASAAVARARRGEGPSVIEGMTYRMDPHIWYDTADYQPASELELWRPRDPIVRERARLLGAGVPAKHLEQCENDAQSEVEDAFTSAEAASVPTWPGLDLQGGHQ